MSSVHRRRRRYWSLVLALTVVLAFAGTALLTIGRHTNDARAVQKQRVQKQPVSSFLLTDFRLTVGGLLFELHPTTSAILVDADSRSPLKLCQYGTSFAGRWKGGCRPLLGRTVQLPSTNGQMHVAFRVFPKTPRVTRVNRLELRWHCTDHDFYFSSARPLRYHPRPSFDC